MYAKCRKTEHYADCHYAECHGTSGSQRIKTFIKIQLSVEALDKSMGKHTYKFLTVVIVAAVPYHKCDKAHFR
jgi:hypothetical protein